MPDTLDEKAARILAEGRLTIERIDMTRTYGWIVARCQGLTGEYRLGWDPILAQYRCTCPELLGKCSHILALKLVVEEWQEV